MRLKNKKYFLFNSFCNYLKEAQNYKGLQLRSGSGAMEKNRFWSHGSGSNSLINILPSGPGILANATEIRVVFIFVNLQSAKFI